MQCIPRYMRRFGFPAIKPPEPFTCSSTSSLQGALGSEAAGAACAACDAWLAGQQESTAKGSAAAPSALWLLLLLPDGTCQSHPLSAWQQVPSALLGLVPCTSYLLSGCS